LHISDCTTQPQQQDMFVKLEPLASHIRNVSKQLYIPASNVSIDEMIARFFGRSGHTFRIKNKPTPQGYKILSLCDSGYTYTFMFMSRIKPSNVDLIPNVNRTGSEVYHLVRQLPSQKAFNIFMDNYFSSINLYNFLRNKGYGACGTVRINTAKFPITLKKEKERKDLEWDHLKGITVDNVLVILWIDNGPVTMLSTIHAIEGEESRVDKERRRPRETSTNSNKLKTVFGESVRKVLPIPKMIDDYNYHMGGVDIADQLRSYYSTQLAVRRTWMPLFFWLLDTAIINCFIICKELKLCVDHKSLRLQLVRDLIKDATGNPFKRTTRSDDQDPIEEQTAIKKYRVTDSFELPLIRFVGNNHFPEHKERRDACLWCRYMYKKNNDAHLKNPPQSQLWCSICGVALCCNKQRSCFKDFHMISD
jgi:hypothetical protein